MYSEKELKTNILYAKLKINDLVKKKKLTDQDILDICTLNIIKDTAQKEFDD